MMLPLILVFLFAFLLDFLLGDPHTKWHPVALTGRFASVMETLCRKVSDGICAGAAGWLILVGICTFSAWIVTWNWMLRMMQEAEKRQMSRGKRRYMLISRPSSDRM